MTNGSDYIDFVESNFNDSDQDQDEGHYYFALSEFKAIVERYGIRKVMDDMDKETEQSIYWHYFLQFKRDNEEDDCPF